MSRAPRWTLVGLALLAVCAMPPARGADTFSLNVDFCSSYQCFSGTNGGLVTLTQTDLNTVTIEVTLSSGLVFHDQGITSFSFNNTNGNLLSSNFLATFSSGSSGATFEKPATNSDGAGNFQYGFQCDSGSNGCAGMPTVLTIVATSSGLTIGSFETTNGGFQGGNTLGSRVDFAANVALSSQSGCTGVIGGGDGSSQTALSHKSSDTTTCSGTSTVPEPTSIAFFGSGLIGVGFVLRKKFARR